MKKLAIISGGSKGLGAALCSRYSAAGFHLVEFSRTAPHHFSVRADFSDPAAMAAIVVETLSPLAQERYEEIVVISNAARVQPVGPLSRKDSAQIIATANINYASALLFISESIRLFQEQPCKKTIASITSGAASSVYAGWTLYCSAKAALESAIRVIALEQEAERHPFAAINVDPGVMDTDMQAVIRETSEKDFPALRRFLDLKESNALRSPETVADIVARIISQNSGNGIRYSVYDYVGGR